MSITSSVAARANGQLPASAQAASRASDRRWEFLFQSGRMPAKGQDQQAFLRYLCRQLEATTINTALQAARRSLPADGPMSGGFAGSMFQGLADEEYSRMLAARGGFGLGDQMYKQMAKTLAAKAYEAAQGARPGSGNAAQGTLQKSDN